MRFIAIIAIPANPGSIPGVIVMKHAHQLFDQLLSISIVLIGGVVSALVYAALAWRSRRIHKR